MSPAVITLIHDELDQHILLARHRRHNEGGRSPGQLFTCIAGFCSPGETLEQTVRREVAEEVSRTYPLDHGITAYFPLLYKT
jgi:NADH pyrophosphatase NudC (nudix superfamily)